jgi:hypothetical protein
LRDGAIEASLFCGFAILRDCFDGEGWAAEGDY